MQCTKVITRSRILLMCLKCSGLTSDSNWGDGAD